MALAGDIAAMAKAAEVYKAVINVFLVNNGVPLPKFFMADLIYRRKRRWEADSASPKDAPNFDLLKKNFDNRPKPQNKAPKFPALRSMISSISAFLESFCDRRELTTQQNSILS
jgi:hypothetical protein